MGNTATVSSTPVPVLEQVESDLLSGTQVDIWWPNDNKSYPGRILPNTPGRSIVSILYDDGEVKRYKRDTFLLTRLAIGKVMKISLILWSIGLFILRVLDFRVCMCFGSWSCRRNSHTWSCVRRSPWKQHRSYHNVSSTPRSHESFGVGSETGQASHNFLCLFIEIWCWWKLVVSGGRREVPVDPGVSFGTFISCHKKRGDPEK